MSLLKIFDPEILKNVNTIGIDFGTSNSCVSSVLNNGIVEIIPDDNGCFLLPSIVQYFKKNKKRIGFDVKFNNFFNEYDIIFSIKRLIGRDIKDLNKISKNIPYKIINIFNKIYVKTICGLKTPIDISSDILSALRIRSEKVLFGNIDGVVITVPAYFDNIQRRAIKDAACSADLKVLRILNEPTAAAIAYGLDNKSEGIYVVYDFGGGTFDLSVLKLTNGIFEVLSSNGDSFLGGDDFDLLLLNYIINKSNLVLSDFLFKDICILLKEIRKAKELLSLINKVYIKISIGNIKINIKIDRYIFEEIIINLVKRTLFLTKQALRYAGVILNKIKGIVLVGGTTKIPIIQTLLKDFFQRDLITSVNPDQIVSFGAAIYADILVNNKNKHFILLDVIPFSFGIEVFGGFVEKIIHRNSLIPIVCKQKFTTYVDNQTSVLIHVVQGEKELAINCRSIVRFELKNIFSMKAGMAKICVTYSIDSNGLLSVSAYEKLSNVKISIKTNPSYKLYEKNIVKV